MSLRNNSFVLLLSRGRAAAGIAILAAAAAVQAQCPPSFAPAANYPAGTQSLGLAVGDLNADGRPDLAVANVGPFPGNVVILLGNPGGTLQWAGSYAAGEGPFAVAVGDFNADAKADLAVANDGSVSVLLGNGNGTFQAALDYPIPLIYLLCIAVGEFNGDGKPDLAASGSNSFGAGVDGFYILLGNGNGTFQAAVGYPTTSSGQFWEIGIDDFNSDGKADIAVTNTDASGVFVLLGNGNGTFQPAVLYVTGGEPTALGVSDFNADGKRDLAVGSVSGSQGKASILLGNGNGTFQPAVHFAVPRGNGTLRIAVGDFNADGRPDLAAAGLYGRVSVLVGNGDGTFRAAVFFEVGLQFPGDVAAGDFNADGQVDVAASFINGSWPQNSSVSVLLNTSGCYPDCNHDCQLTVADFGCFQTKFVLGDMYADCNTDGALTVADFGCLQSAFVLGCR
ncbi:MAG: FG-GAP repeat domain-containing protein [Phycisphaerales bacterium]